MVINVDNVVKSSNTKKNMVSCHDKIIQHLKEIN